MLYKLVVVLLKILVFLIFNLKIYNSDKINNSKGRIIACSNHISLIDPIILAISSKRQVHFMGKKELFENRLLSYVFRKLGAFPVDREGVSFSAIKNSLNVLKNDEVLGIYPEGTRISEGYNENNAKPGIAMIAYKAKSKIIPVYIKGPYKFRGKIEIYFGEPKDYFINISEKINSEKYAEIGKEILKDIYKLEKTGKPNVY